MNSGVLLDLFLRFVEVFRNRDVIITFVITMLMSVVVYQNQDYLFGDKQRFEKYAEQKFNADTECQKLRREWGSKGTSIYLFHNGTVTLNKIHIMKMSLMFDSRCKLCKSTKLVEQNIPLGPFVYHLRTLKNNNCIYIRDVDCVTYTADGVDEYEDLKHYIHSVDSAVKSIVMLPLYCDNEFVGMVSSAYHRPTNLKAVDIRNMLLDVKTHIEPLFNSSTRKN